MCRETADAHTALTMDASASPGARAFLRSTYCPVHSSAVLDDALLLVSELVTNAVVHGSPPIVLSLRCDESRGMQVRVRDSDPALPRAEQPSPEDEHGRGVFLVDYISDDWGVDATSDGKEIWFLLGGDPSGGAGSDTSADLRA